jgi:hypothetical protein
VLWAVRARLARPDLKNLLANPASQEARQAADEIRRLRGRLEQTRQDYDNDLARDEDESHGSEERSQEI